MQKICFALLMLMIAALSPAWAEDVSVQASVSAAKVSLKEVVQLRLTVNGSKDALGPVNLPTIDGFDVRYLGPSTNISIVNGDYHSERSFIYNLFPTKAGHLQVPAITIDVNGKSYATKPVDVEVVNGPSGNAEAQPDQNAAPTVESLKDKIFLAVNVPVTDVYVNERVPLTIKLFVREIPIRDIQMPKLEAEGFSLDSYQQPKQYAQVVNGLRYEVVEFKVFLYPNRLGAVNVGPAQVEGNLLYKTDRHNPFTGSALDDDFFSGIFNSYSTRPVTVSAAPLTLHVSPLPEPQPEGFSGAVGLFDFTAGVTPPEVKVGDPLTLRMTVSGSGNWKNWHMPVFSDSHFKTYDPQIKDDANTRTLEQVIIPTQEGTTEVPATHFIYFDPSAKEYKTLTQGPFAVQVSKADPGQEFKAVGFNDMSQQPTLAAPVKVDIMASLQESVSKIWLWCLDLLKNPLFWFGFILVLFIGDAAASAT